MLACVNGCTEAAAMLVDKGASLDMLNKARGEGEAGTGRRVQEGAALRFTVHTYGREVLEFPQYGFAKMPMGATKASQS